jgi:4'-phosphopantetheinyl transferase
MVRILLSTISSLKQTLGAGSVDSSLCKIFPKLAQYQQQEKQFASVLGHLMCEQIFFDVKLTPQVLSTLHQNTYGKWQFEGAQLDFSISHSDDKVIVVASDEGRVGVDIESVRPIEMTAYEDCFTPSEWKSINEGDDYENNFYDFWTKKESFLKAWGMGLQIPLAHVMIDNNKGSIPDRNMHGHFLTVVVPGYCCCICTTFDIAKAEVEEFVLKI